MLYVVKADNLNLRVDHRVGSAVFRTLPLGSLVWTDLTFSDPSQPTRTGYDDPSTPQPADSSYNWVRVVSYRLTPRSKRVNLRTPVWAALEWLRLVRDERGNPVEG